MNTSKIKKGLSLLLSIIMIFTMMPVTIFSLGADVSDLPVMEAYNAASSGDYHKYYNKVCTVTFLNSIDEASMNASDTVDKWDVSEAKDGSVMAWMKKNAENTSFYDVYIAGEGGIAANPNSSYIFYCFTALKEVNGLENLKTDNVTNLNRLFEKCSSLEKLDMSSWNTSKVTTMAYMFSECKVISEIDVSNWDTSNVTTMGYLFNNCQIITELDISSFDTSKVTNMEHMFYNCEKLANLYVGKGWNVDNVTNGSAAFNCCKALPGFDENNSEIDISFADKYAKPKEENPQPEVKEYTVTYSFTGDVIPENVTLPTVAEYEEGTTVFVEPAPTADGYIFNGWTSEDADITTGSFNIANDVHIVGSWEKLYKVNYKYDENFEVPEGAPTPEMLEMLGSTQRAGDDVDVAGVLYADGRHIFVGWYTDDADIAGNMFTMPEKDVTLYCYFKIPVESIEILDNENLVLNGGETSKLNVYVKPDDATIKDIIYESSDPDIATVDKYGNITAVEGAEGTATITVKSKDDPTKSDTIEITVKQPVTELTVTPTDITIREDGSEKIKVTVNEDATNKEVTFTSKDETIVTVDENGVITPVGPGTTTITVASKDDPSIKKTVTVTVKNPVTDITAPKDVTIVVGETESLNAKVNEDATNQGLEYESDNPGVVKVDIEGNITAVGKGEATITITSKDDPSITETVIVKVIKYNVTYAFVGEDIPENVIVPDGAEYGSGETVIVENNPTAKGYTFSGWTTKDPANIKDGKFNIYNDVHFVGSWSRNSYEVTYEYTGEVPDGAPEVPGKEVKSFGTTVEVKDAPTLDRYTFSGWTTENADVADGQFIMPDNNVNFVGHWEKIPVKDIIVDKTEITLNPNDTDKITATVKPDDATNKEVIFESTDEDVVKVDENGNITAVGEGEAEIIIKADGKEITVKVTVEKPYISVENIIVDKTEITLNPNDTDKITATVKPDDATNKEVTFESSNENVVVVDKDGNITAKNEGEATITVKADGKVTTVKVTVEKPYIPVEDILIYKKEFELEPGDTDKIIAVVTPNEATDKDITYTSDDETVVKVDENGNITAVGEGTATITVASKADPAKSETVTVKVEKVVVPVEDVLLHKKEFELEPGDTDKIIAVVTPNEATDKDITYTSDDETVVKVDENGNITAVGEGTATITVASKADPTKSKTVTVTVKKPPVIITAPEKITIVLGEEQDIGATINADAKLSYSSSDESIVKVDENGRITAVAEGEVKITVTAAGYPELKSIVIVKVSGKPSYSTKHYMVFGKTEKIGWYSVSLDGGETFLLVFGNSHLEVEHGSEVIIKANDVFGDPFTFYINGKAVKPDENGYVRVIVDKYVLVGALGIPVEAPDVEESLNFFQRMIQAIKNFFAKIASWFKR